MVDAGFPDPVVERDFPDERLTAINIHVQPTFAALSQGRP